MPYQFLEDIAIADVAFKAWGATIEEMFVSAAEATMNVMVEDLETIERREEKVLRAETDGLENLLFQFLQEFIYFKDAESLLLRATKVVLTPKEMPRIFTANVYGERIDPVQHSLHVDVKAVTWHLFKVTKTRDGWEATVVLDI